MNYRKQEKTGLLPPILPLVVYHGENQWKAAPRFQDLVGLTGVMARHVPDFEYLIWDLSQYTDDVIRGGVLLRVAALLMKHIHAKDIGRLLPGILGLLEDLNDSRTALQFLRAALRYLSSGSHVSKDELMNALKEIRIEEGGDLMATLAQQWIEEGMEKGIEKGMLEDAREMVQEAIFSKFGFVPEDIVHDIRELKDRERLRGLLREAVVCSDLNGFKKALQEARA